jgi:multidrug efflux pump subunit AcrA (membrane-fusion protein)
MKNITLSAEESLIEQARVTARAQKTTLNQLFRQWLEELAGKQEREQQLTALMERLDYVRSGGPFSREEMNEH